MVGRERKRGDDLGNPIGKNSKFYSSWDNEGLDVVRGGGAARSLFTKGLSFLPEYLSLFNDLTHGEVDKLYESRRKLNLNRIKQDSIYKDSIFR